MPGIVGSLAAAEAASMFADNLAVTPDDDAIGVSAQLSGTPRRLGRDAAGKRSVKAPGQAAARFRSAGFQFQGSSSAICRAG